VKILLTVHQFLPEYSSGTEILTFETAKQLRRLGHEVLIFTGFPNSQPLNDEERFDSYEYQGLHVERFHYDYKHLGGQSSTTEAEYNNLFFAAYFRKFLARIKPDIVHFFHLGKLSASAVEVCHSLNIPMVLTATDFWFICPTAQLRLPDNSMCPGPRGDGANCLRHLAELNWAGKAKTVVRRMPDSLLALGIKAIELGVLNKTWYASHVKAISHRYAYTRTQMNRIDRVLVPTRLMESILKNNSLEAQRICYAPFGLNLEYLQFSLRNNTSGPLRLGFIGTLSEHKGVHVLVQAITALEENVEVQLTIYGDESQYPDYVSRLKLLAGSDPRIRFCGTFPNHEIGRVFSSLDVLVVPSLWYENSPLVIYSAQAAGCPVIVSDLPGMTEPIGHEDNGLAFQPGNTAELAQAIVRLYKDRGLLQQLSQRARKPRSADEYARQIEAVYGEIVPEKTGKGRCSLADGKLTKGWANGNQESDVSLTKHSGSSKSA
jgi:glycosyltransferase involved in cell wall biosynthesis